MEPDKITKLPTVYNVSRVKSSMMAAMDRREKEAAERWEAKKQAVEETHRKNPAEEVEKKRSRTSVMIAGAMAAWCIVLALVNFHAIWPYQISRWVICAGSIWLCFNLPDGWRRITAIVVALAFNPLVPLYFGKAWPFVDLITAGALIVAGLRKKMK